AGVGDIDLVDLLFDGRHAALGRADQDGVVPDQRDQENRRLVGLLDNIGAASATTESTKSAAAKSAKSAATRRAQGGRIGAHLDAREHLDQYAGDAGAVRVLQRIDIELNFGLFGRLLQILDDFENELNVGLVVTANNHGTQAAQRFNDDVGTRAA